MQTIHITIDPATPDPSVIARAAEVLRAGGLVAFPTETVYGLGANALNGDAVSSIYAAKGRPSTNPLIVHVPNAASALKVASCWPQSAQRLAERFWPGPLTMVLDRRPEVPSIVTGGGDTVAVRVPAHPVALALIQAADVPIAAPSANRSQRLSPTSAHHVLRDLDGRIAMVLDAGPTSRGLESTVLDLTSNPPRLLRPGPIFPTEIEAVIGPVARPYAKAKGDKPMPSPGMLTRHYAPRTPLEVANLDRVRELVAQGLRVGWVTMAPVVNEPEGVAQVTMPDAPRGYGAKLFAALHRLDDAEVDRIIVQPPPDTEEWLAVRDRLRRASTP